MVSRVSLGRLNPGILTGPARLTQGVRNYSEAGGKHILQLFQGRDGIPGNHRRNQDQLRNPPFAPPLTTTSIAPVCMADDRDSSSTWCHGGKNLVNALQHLGQGIGLSRTNRRDRQQKER